MADEECPHGLEPAWCTLCKQQAAAKLPQGVRRPTPPPRVRRAPAAPRPAGRPVVPPSAGLAGVRKVLFHASAYEAWPSIAAGGLLTAAQLLARSEQRGPEGLRERDLVVIDPDGAARTIRDQRPLIRANIEQHLSDIALTDWLALLDERVFLFAQQKSLTTMLARYVPSGGQDVVVFDTARLLAAARGRVEVATDELSAPEPWAHCPCRGRDTFVALDAYRGSPTDIFEVAVVGGIEDVTGLVSRVVRYHPDHTTEVIVS